MSAGPKSYFTTILNEAGVELGGSRPFDVTVHDDRLWGRVISHGTTAPVAKAIGSGDKGEATTSAMPR